MTTVREVEWVRVTMPDGGRFVGNALRFGNGARPRTAIVAGLHGDETTGIYVLSRLRSMLAEMAGTVDIVPVVNWLGLLLNRRDSPIDGENMNRLFGPTAPPRWSSGIAAALLEFVVGADLVIDLHAWESPTALLGISYWWPLSMDDRLGRALAHLECDYVWIPEEDGFQSTLGARLHSLGTPSLALELPPPARVNEAQVTDLARSLARALRDDVLPPPLPPAGGRMPVLVPTAGLMDPLVRPADVVGEGQPLVHILSPSSLRPVATLSAPSEGIVLHLENRRFLQVGDRAAFLGAPYAR